ncbi:MAG: hypothetical protein SVW02_01150, partial [Candidatus Nanohaloarchaea archaeon]|nr:hypothetical protein [Candidatus Nanohaloarchaea archaeon]
MNRSVSLPDDWVEQSESGALADHRHPVSGEEVEVRYRLDPEQDAVRQKPVAVRYAVPDGDDVVEYEERFSTLGDAKRFLGQAGVDVSVEPYEHLDVRGPMERVAYADY